MDIDLLLNTFLSQNFETEVLEFKEAKNNYDFDSLGEYFSALSNEANLKGHDEAWLIFGVKDRDKSIVGTQFRSDQAKLHSLKAEIANHTTNRIAFKEKMEEANATLKCHFRDFMELSQILRQLKTEGAR